MVIRFTKAARFLCVCALLLLTALIGIGTKSVTVSTPYSTRGPAMPVVVYRNLDNGKPNGLTLDELEADIAWLEAEGYEALSELELVAALRRESPLPEHPVLLLFDDQAKSFTSNVQPILKEAGLNWFSMSKSNLLSNELRAAGYPVTRIERVSGFEVGEQINA